MTCRCYVCEETGCLKETDLGDETTCTRDSQTCIVASGREMSSYLAILGSSHLTPQEGARCGESVDGWMRLKRPVLIQAWALLISELATARYHQLYLSEPLITSIGSVKHNLSFQGDLCNIGLKLRGTNSSIHSILINLIFRFSAGNFYLYASYCVQNCVTNK